MDERRSGSADQPQETPMNVTKTAAPAKLRDGSWGARVQGDAAVGDVVTITTRAGKTWDARVKKVLWSGDGIALCATTSLDREPSFYAGGYAGSGYGPRFDSDGARRGAGRVCRTGGNCSSFGSGRSCGAPDCDGF
jgi:hypothetical protein